MSTEQMTQSDLENALFSIDQVNARRYSKLTGEPRDIATDAIRRYFHACARMEVNPDVAIIRQCIDDALEGHRMFTCGGGASTTNAN